MTKRWILICSLSLALTGWCLANARENLIPLHYFDLANLSQEDIQQLLEHPIPSNVLVCPAGTRLLVNFLLNGDLIEMEKNGESPYTLVVKQLFYLRFDGEQIEISQDGMAWKNGLEFLTGSLSASLNAIEDGPHLELGAEAWVR